MQQERSMTLCKLLLLLQNPHRMMLALQTTPISLMQVGCRLIVAVKDGKGSAECLSNQSQVSLAHQQCRHYSKTACGIMLRRADR